MPRAALVVLCLAGCGRLWFGGSDADSDDARCVSAGTPILWSRTADWRDGMTAGSTLGNPGRDSRGDAVWYYEATTGGPLGASDAWYAQSATMLVWDDSWYGSPGLWAAADDVGPIIDPVELTHILQTGMWNNVARVRWQDPLASTANLTFAGSLHVHWSGNSATAFATDVDLVIAELDATGALKQSLFEMRATKPTPDPSLESVIISVPQTQGMLAPGDSVVISARAADTSLQQDAWVTVIDAITLVATPCSS